MKRTIRPNSRPGCRRRGVTLVEMLVTVAMLVIIMTVLVQVFQAATGALSAAQTIQQLDDKLKLLDATIRSDLSNVTCTFTPPLNPAKNPGYFEYGENEFADTQGEDSDDYVRFTAQAPPGRPFTGRMWVTSPANGSTQGNNSLFYNGIVQPVTITSDYAEIIYFLRNGNLYRRVLLIAPELQSAIVPAIGNTGYLLSSGATTTFSPQTSPFNGAQVLSWQGVNDLSARPAATGPNGSVTAGALTMFTQAAQGIVLNTLGDLTNRENRAFYSRFANDFQTVSSTNGYTLGPDGVPDDVNGDNVPDYYPTLYPGIFPKTAGGIGAGPAAGGNQLIFEPNYNNFVRGYLFDANSNPLAGFPFVFPGAYSRAQTLVSGYQLGWIHSPEPQVYVNGGPLQYDQAPSAALPNPALTYLQNINHNPLDLADNLTTPINQTGYEQTWWGFPTWRETLSPYWTDPTIQVNVGASLATSPSPTQPTGLVPLAADVSLGYVKTGGPLLPAMTTLWRSTPQLYTDGAGDLSNNGVNTFFNPPKDSFNTAYLWNTASWEDDLIMTNVRSFDVKAYDNALVGYGDLGWGDDLRMYVPYQNSVGFLSPGTVPPYLGVTQGTWLPQATIWPPVTSGGIPYSTINQTFAHEGRMPPLVEDNRLDAQNPNPTYQYPIYSPPNQIGYIPQYPNFAAYSSNIGDDNTIVRLRRVWDTWSTEYSQAPATGAAAIGATPGFPVGPPFSPPIYPSYPPPYPAPLRGIQIQIRVADPTNQRVKSITIRQDFTDKL